MARKLKTHIWNAIPSVQNVAEPLEEGLRSAARPLRVLEFFDEIRRPARAREIWERLGLPQSTASRLLNGMTLLGFLEFDAATRTFQPSLRVTLLGSWRDSGRLRAGSLMRMLEGLSERTGCSASLSIRNGIHVRYLQTVQEDAPGIPHVVLSARRYSVWSAAGIMLLADLPDAEIKTLLRRTLAETDPVARRIDPGRVQDMVDQARAQGWFAATGIVTPNSYAVAVTLPAHLNGFGVPLAVTVGSAVTFERMEDAACAQLMRAAVGDLAGPS